MKIKPSLSRLAAAAAIIGALALCYRAFALATARVGPDNDTQKTFAQPDWYRGIVEPLRHPSRVYSVWVNGSESFYFKATPAEINELIDLYAKARLRDHEIVIKRGPGMASSLGAGETKYPYNVSIHITAGIALARFGETANSATQEPLMTILAGDDASFLKELKFPDNVIVRSEVELPEFKGKTSLPQRKAWFGRVHFDDDTRAVDFEAGVTTKTTLWNDGFDEGLPQPGVTYQGLINVVLSDDELSAMRSGKMWLTLTPGNWLAQPKKTDARFPVELLASDTNQAGVYKIARPQNYYYGRILFEDGTPPVVSPKPWPGAEIWVSFPYGAGKATPDAEGYFRVFFDPEQLTALKARAPRPNITVPLEEAGHGREMHFFPPESLSQDKSKAGVVKIPKPDYMTRKKQ